MFKRVLVLVLFLLAVFWWLTNRDGDEAEIVESGVTVEETVTQDEEDEDEAEEEETEEAVEAEVTEEETESVTKDTTVVTPTAQPEPVVVATPTVPSTVLTVVKPVIKAPVTPNRITDVKVFLYEWNVDFSDKTIPAGTVNFTVQNDGRFTHDFSLSGFGNLGKVMPNETRTFTVKLKAGEYEAFSKRRQDYERGVKQTFTVTP